MGNEYATDDYVLWLLRNDLHEIEEELKYLQPEFNKEYIARQSSNKVQLQSAIAKLSETEEVIARELLINFAIWWNDWKFNQITEDIIDGFLEQDRKIKELAKRISISKIKE